MRILGLELPWWVWALIVWGVCLVIFPIVAFVAPADLWTLPVLGEDKLGELTNDKTCDNCVLFKDQLYLTILRKDQCEFPNFTKKVSCNISAECNLDPTKCKPPLSGPASTQALCGTTTIVEPQNTWSNFGYLLAGLLILFRRPSRLGMAVGINFCLIFLFSGLYHASLQNVWQALDVAWIYVLLLSIIAYSLQALRLRYKKLSSSPVVTILSIGFPVAIGVLVTVLKATGNLPNSPLTDSTNITVALVGILGIPVLILLLDFWWLRRKWVRWILERLGCEPKTYWRNLEGREFIWGQQWKFELWMFIPALLGGMFRTALFGLPGDGCGHSLCLPHSPFQAHAAWHVLGALALWWTYNFLAQASVSEDTMVKLGVFAQ
jgi:hypothetical protein